MGDKRGWEFVYDHLRCQINKIPQLSNPLQEQKHTKKEEKNLTLRD